MQLACTDIHCSVVSAEEREALAYLPLRVALGLLLGFWGGLGSFVCFKKI